MKHRVTVDDKTMSRVATILETNVIYKFDIALNGSANVGIGYESKIYIGKNGSTIRFAPSAIFGYDLNIDINYNGGD